MTDDNNNNENENQGSDDIQSLVDQMQDMAETAETKPGVESHASEIRADDKAADVITDRNLDLILDIPLKVSAELGRTKMLVSDLLNLGQGSVVELNKLAGEALEILVNDKIIAKGEAVVVNEKFGVRLTDIISPMERVQQLK